MATDVCNPVNFTYRARKRFLRAKNCTAVLLILFSPVLHFFKDSVKRVAVGIWKCNACEKVIAGGAWTVSTTAAATVRSTVRRLRELMES